MTKIKSCIILSCVALMLSLVGCGGPKDTSSEAVASCMEDLGGHRVSVMLGSLQDLLMPDVGAKPVRLNTITDLLLSVEKGTSEYLLVDSVSFIGLDLEARGMKFLFSDDFCAGQAALAFRYEDVEICAAFNAFLASIKTDGTFDAMKARWTTGDPNEADIPNDFTVPSEGEPLIVGTMANFPFTFIKDNEWTGFEIEMLDRFGAYLGRPMEYVNYDFAALPPALAAGKVNLLCCFIFKTEERAKTMLFSDPYYYSSTACVGRIPGMKVKSSAGLWQGIKDSFVKNFVVESRYKLILEGLWETLVISFFALLFGTLLGGLICLMLMNGGKVLRGIAKVYVDIMQGVPILVLLMIMFYVVFASGGITARWVAVIAFGMNLSAYVAEMLRTSINGVEKGQTEAGLAMGFSRVKTFAYFVLPQALKRMIPVYRGDAISIIKSTSIVGYIAIQDLTKMSDIIRSRTFDAFFPLIVVSIIYFLIAWLLGRLLDALNKKLK